MSLIPHYVVHCHAKDDHGSAIMPVCSSLLRTFMSE